MAATRAAYNIFAALATQAYDGSRQAFARRELIAALLLLQQNNYAPSEMVSSWAGAFGQTQFMPSTFFKYATDGDGDGKIDLWHSTADALASTAVLFQREGWQAAKPWGYEVESAEGFRLSGRRSGHAQAFVGMVGARRETGFGRRPARWR